MNYGESLFSRNDTMMRFIDTYTPHCAWDPCAEEPHFACEHCHTRLYSLDRVYVDKRGAFWGCEDCVEETFEGGLDDLETGEEIVGAGEWRSVALMDWEGVA